MVEGPLRGGVTDHDDTLILEPGWEIVQEASDTRHDVAIALPAGIGLVRVLAPCGLEPGNGRAVQHPVVALSEAPVVENRNALTGERDARSLGSAVEIRGERRGNLVGAVTLAELLRLSSPER